MTLNEFKLQKEDGKLQALTLKSSRQSTTVNMSQVKRDHEMDISAVLLPVDSQNRSSFYIQTCAHTHTYNNLRLMEKNLVVSAVYKCLRDSCTCEKFSCCPGPQHNNVSVAHI